MLRHYLLMPFALIYGFVIRMRNMLFDIRVLPSVSFPVPVICVGNIAVGGTGKTPITEYLVALLLQKQYRIATLSRGYKRQTQGFRMVTTASTATEAGDEACQIKKKFPQITVAVDANRRRGIRRLLALPTDQRPDVILLDDAMQHRYVAPSLTIMLTEYDNLFYQDRLLPAGSLRESARAVSRADIIVVTKCTGVLKPIDLRIIDKNMSLMANQRLYFSKIKYLEIEAMFPSTSSPDNIDEHKHVLLIAGIAHPHGFIDRIKSVAHNVEVCTFADHHAFDIADIRKIDAVFRTMPVGRRLIICTEKDAMRLRTLDFLPDEWKSCLYYLPISVQFLNGRGDYFDAQIIKHILSSKI